MSLQLESLQDLQSHVDDFPFVPLFYEQQGNDFTVLAGRVSWKGSFGSEEKVTEFEQWLHEHGAKKVHGFKSLEELFLRK